MTIDLKTLWDFNKPELSEERFRAALATAPADDVLILQTQIARTHGLRRNFAQAQAILADLEPQVPSASLEAQAHYYLELGRTFSSATHSPESQTSQVRERARAAFQRTIDIAQKAKLDGLAIDALHMMTFVDTAPQEQIAWNRKALALMQASPQPEAKTWEATLHNNTGYALHQLGEYENALAEFQVALTAHERSGNPENVRIAHWMIAWTLRAMGQLEEAIAIQLRLEKECEEAGEPDPYVFEELELLYQALHNQEKAEFYAARRKAAS